MSAGKNCRYSLATLHVQNFGLFSDLMLEISPITILSGDSATGKTLSLLLLYRLLKSISQIIKGFDPKTVLQEELHGDPVIRELLRRSSKAGKLRIDLYCSGSEEVSFVLECRVMPDGSVRVDNLVDNLRESPEVREHLAVLLEETVYIPEYREAIFRKTLRNGEWSEISHSDNKYVELTKQYIQALQKKDSLAIYALRVILTLVTSMRELHELNPYDEIDQLSILLKNMPLHLNNLSASWLSSIALAPIVWDILRNLLEGNPGRVYMIDTLEVHMTPLHQYLTTGFLCNVIASVIKYQSRFGETYFQLFSPYTIIITHSPYVVDIVGIIFKGLQHKLEVPELGITLRDLMRELIEVHVENVFAAHEKEGYKLELPEEHEYREYIAAITYYFEEGKKYQLYSVRSSRLNLEELKLPDYLVEYIAPLAKVKFMTLS